MPSRGSTSVLRINLVAALISLTWLAVPELAFACNLDEARTNVEWVLRKDEGARRTYNNQRDQSLSPYRAVLAAQAHNRRAQDSIRECGSHLVVLSMLCDDAPKNIDWVLFEDRGARASFDDARKSGMSDLDAVLYAQRHNQMAQDSVVACGRYWAARYIRDRLAGGPGIPVEQPQPADNQGIFLCKESSSGGEPYCKPTEYSRETLESQGFECEDYGAQVRCF